MDRLKGLVSKNITLKSLNVFKGKNACNVAWPAEKTFVHSFFYISGSVFSSIIRVGMVLKNTNSLSVY